MKILGEDIIVIDAIFISTVIICSMFIYVFTTPRPAKPIFPMWILNEYRKAPKSEMMVSSNEGYFLYIGVENKMGCAEYCNILVKFRNLSMPIPSTASSTPTPIDSTHSYRFLLSKDEKAEIDFNFKIIGEEIKNSFLIHSVEINGQLCELSLNSNLLNAGAFEGYYYQVIFELWLLNAITRKFYFSGVWTSSPFLHISE